MLSKNTRFWLFVSIVPALLLIPFVAMQFTEEIQWKSGDFIVAGGLLLVTALMMEWILRKEKNRRKRFLLIAIILLILLVTWLELAVGIFGSPLTGN